MADPDQPLERRRQAVLGGSLQDGTLQDTALALYSAMAPSEVVRSALDHGLNAQQTLDVLERLGHAATISEVLSARDAVRQEALADYNFEASVASAMIKRRAEAVYAIAMQQALGGDPRALTPALRAVELQARLFNVDRHDKGAQSKLEAELDKVSAARKAGASTIPLASDADHGQHDGRMAAALARYEAVTATVEGADAKQ